MAEVPVSKDGLSETLFGTISDGMKSLIKLMPLGNGQRSDMSISSGLVFGAG
jgi:hypothetical protein